MPLNGILASLFTCRCVHSIIPSTKSTHSFKILSFAVQIAPPIEIAESDNISRWGLIVEDDKCNGALLGPEKCAK